MAIAAIGTFLVSHVDTDWEQSRFMLDNAIRTGALGLLFTPLTTAALVNVPRNRAGAASGILNTVWQVGGRRTLQRSRLESELLAHSDDAWPGSSSKSAYAARASE
ncbi:MAG: hypothetical protein ACXWNM_18525 [Vulcanimicrobiaceae bacterium]